MVSATMCRQYNVNTSEITCVLDKQDKWDNCLLWFLRRMALKCDAFIVKEELQY